jgi:DMSO/TMAO reductase YedYZ molybdopterin-dependent catalytic subunit
MRPLLLGWSSAGVGSIAQLLRKHWMSEAFEYKVKGFFARIPSEPHKLIERTTPTRDCIVLCHLGVLEVSDGDAWEIEIAGMIGRPMRVTVRDLKRMPKVTVASVHQCAGSPLAPDKPTQRVCNVTWGGVRLDDVLQRVEPDPEAAFVWSIGADAGEFGGADCGHYTKDLPRSRVGADVLLAYEMNGEPLLPEHGHPLRLVVPGFYGTNSVKWLRRIELRKERAPGPFTTRWYNDVVAEGVTRPVWNIAPQSVIVWPVPGTSLEREAVVRASGWAWADGGVAGVKISLDEGLSWKACAVEKPTGHSWTQFMCDFEVAAGQQSIVSRATSRSGENQPDDGKRNALYRVPFTVV